MLTIVCSIGIFWTDIHYFWAATWCRSGCVYAFCGGCELSTKLRPNPMQTTVFAALAYDEIVENTTQIITRATPEYEGLITFMTDLMVADDEDLILSEDLAAKLAAQQQQISLAIGRLLKAFMDLDTISEQSEAPSRHDNILLGVSAIRDEMSKALGGLFPLRFTLDSKRLNRDYHALGKDTLRLLEHHRVSIDGIWKAWWRLLDEHKTYSMIILEGLETCPESDPSLLSRFGVRVKAALARVLRHPTSGSAYSLACTAKLESLWLNLPPFAEDLLHCYDATKFVRALTIYTVQQIEATGLLVPLTRAELRKQLETLDWMVSMIRRHQHGSTTTTSA